MTLKRALMVLVLTALAALSGCGGNGGHPGSSLPDRGLSTTYVVTGITVGGKAHALVKGTEVRIRFADAKVTITAGCNTMSGGYTLEESRLTVEPLAMTEMGCDQSRMAQDSWLAGLFAKPVQLTTGDEPTIVSGSTVLAMADREKVSPDKPLLGTTWLMDSIGNGDVVGSVAADLGATLRFTSDSVKVSDGCNTGQGTVTIDGATITFSDIVMTMLPCPTVRGDIPGALYAMLDGSASYAIEENHLTLRSGDRSLGFTAQPSRIKVPPDKPLVGTKWRLDTEYPRGFPVSVPDRISAWIHFDRHGHFRFDDGCNEGGGRASVHGDRITARMVAVTLVLCRGPNLPDFYGVLSGTSTYAIEGRSLTITDGGHKLRFHAVSWLPRH